MDMGSSIMTGVPKPANFKNTYNCGHDHGVMCMWVPGFTLPASDGKDGKKPRNMNCKRAWGYHTLGVVMMSMPASFRLR